MKEIAKIKLYVQFVIQLWLDSGKRLLWLLKLPPEKKEHWEKEPWREHQKKFAANSHRKIQACFNF